MSKKTDLIDAAANLLWDKGYEATSPKDIQKLAGAGQGSFYHHFESKKDLAIQTLDRVGQEMQETLSPLETETNSAKALQTYLERPRNAVNGCKMGRMMADKVVQEDEGLARPVRQYFDHLQMALKPHAHILKPSRGEKPSDVTDADLALLLSAVVQGGFILGRVYDDPDIHKRLSKALLALHPEIEDTENP